MNREGLTEAQVKAHKEAVAEGVVKFVIGLAMLVGGTWFFGGLVASGIESVRESWWLALLPLFFGYMLLVTVHASAEYVCEPLALGLGHRLGLIAITLVLGTVWFLDANWPLGKGPHRTKVVVIPEGAVMGGEVEWTRGRDGVVLDRVHIGKDKPIELHGCEEKPEEFKAKCDGENGRRWVVLPASVF